MLQSLWLISFVIQLLVVILFCVYVWVCFCMKMMSFGHFWLLFALNISTTVATDLLLNIIIIIIYLACYLFASSYWHCSLFKLYILDIVTHRGLQL